MEQHNTDFQPETKKEPHSTITDLVRMSKIVGRVTETLPRNPAGEITWEERRESNSRKQEQQIDAAA
jgi:hypothetical protein